jgi:glycerophosphoryl diester phosphodiesterase
MNSIRVAPSVIAHRGASGYLPEHTLAAKALAHAQGADYLEQDVVATRDGHVIVCHDLYLERVTNVVDVFPARNREDGHYYAIDFDWSEIRKLTVSCDVVAAAALVDAAAPAASGEPFRICLLDEEIEFIHGLNSASSRSVGIYPEIKNPGWHARHGCDLSSALLGILADHGYRSAEDPVFVQCVDADELRRLKKELQTELRLTQLIGRSTDPGCLTREAFVAVADYAVALGPNYRLVLTSEADGQPRASPLVNAARDAGLQLHPYTFNYAELPADVADLDELLALAYEVLRADAVFCDFPDVAVGLRDAQG